MNEVVVAILPENSEPLAVTISQPAQKEVKVSLYTLCNWLGFLDR